MPRLPEQQLRRLPHPKPPPPLPKSELSVGLVERLQVDLTADWPAVQPGPIDVN